MSAKEGARDHTRTSNLRVFWTHKRRKKQQRSVLPLPTSATTSRPTACLVVRKTMPSRTPPRRASRGSGQGLGKRERKSTKLFSPELPSVKANKDRAAAGGGGARGGGRGRGRGMGRGRGRGALSHAEEGVNKVRSTEESALALCRSLRRHTLRTSASPPVPHTVRIIDVLVHLSIQPGHTNAIFLTSREGCLLFLQYFL